MGVLTPAHVIGATLTLLLFIGLGIYSGKKVKNDADFDTGGKSANALLVAGSITGTLVGGSSTIGTAQLAFTNGLSAWWFTLGSALGCLILACFFTKALRDSECTTIQEIIRVEYGQTAGVVTSILTSVGIILNIVAQILASNALLTTIFGLNSTESTIISIIIMACYVVFGGVKGAGLLGVVKLFFIYIGVIAGGIIALKQGGGLGNFYKILPHQQYFNLFSRGFGIDAGAGLSVLLGVLSTQSYIQAVLSGKTSKEAKKGAILSTVLIPPIGILCTFIGMYMRINYQSMDAAQVFPQFVIKYMPPIFSGIVLATLLIAVVGTGSGMALGFGTIVTNDIYKRFFNKNADGRSSIRVTRITIIVSLIISAIFANGNLKSTILTWGFMSMGLRAVVLFIPMCTALFYKGRVNRVFVTASSFCGIIAMLVGKVLNFPFDTLFLGMAVSIIIIFIGSLPILNSNNIAKIQ